jgi:putative transposase
MPQSLSQINLHIVFSTKNRQPYLHDPALRLELFNYLGGICRNLDCPSLIIGGVEDHVHIACRLSRTQAVSDLVRELKRESSKWLKTKSVDLADFHWQDGYGVFSVSPKLLPTLRDYIAGQEEHHKKETFQDEVRRMLKQYGVEFDERYVWD